ncbi:hypothetical protein NQ317_015539 [Molorchus minor]|uniref:Uncharacterized protein n=1 Tax=Molorchus minor TaxID=1323400 RepID=A0ABQ9JR42_9CUCU|nr:hypothetical protein NQ317_015539 [Molorchus minor]
MIIDRVPTIAYTDCPSKLIQSFTRNQTPILMQRWWNSTCNRSNRKDKTSNVAYLAFDNKIHTN